MAKNNKFRLAEQFIEDLQVALQSEADYYSEGSEDVVAEYKKRHCNNLENFEERGHYYSSMPYERHSTKPVWSKRALFPLSKVFPIKCAELNNRKHPFQKLIDKHPSYNNALSTFRRKLIFIPMNHRYTKQEVSPISLDVMLDHFLAKAILAWDGFQISNFEKYVFSSKTEMESIERKAQELFKAIDAAHDNIKRSIKPDAIKCIESLAHGYDGKAIENVIPIKLRETEQDWKHKRNIKLKNIHSSYDRVAPKINHNKSGKEILMRILVSDYRYKFGVYDLIRIPKGIKSNVDY